MKKIRKRLNELEQLSKRKPKHNNDVESWTDLYMEVCDTREQARAAAQDFIDRCKAKGVPPTWVELAKQAKEAENENAERNL